MRPYLDDDTANGVLFTLLVTAGHNVVEPVSGRFSGQTHTKHLIRSIETGRAVATQNYKDFAQLHELIKVAGGAHKGIPVIRKDNDSTRDLSLRGIVNATRKLQDSGLTIENEYHNLNHWR